MEIKLLVDGGNMKPGPALSQKLGPLGLNINQVIQTINEATKNFDGMKVPVEMNVNPSTKEIEVKVFPPSVSELLKRELGIEKGSGVQRKVQVANASIEQIIYIAKTKLPNLLSGNLKAAVKTVLGTCASLGILVESKPAVDIEKEIDIGRYDKEIAEARTETPSEKKKNLAEHFAKIKSEQEKIIEQEAKKEEETKPTQADKTEKKGDEKTEKGEKKEAKKK